MMDVCTNDDDSCRTFTEDLDSRPRRSATASRSMTMMKNRSVRWRIYLREPRRPLLWIMDTGVGTVSGQVAICIYNDEFCIKMMDFVFEMMI